MSKRTWKKLTLEEREALCLLYDYPDELKRKAREFGMSAKVSTIQRQIRTHKEQKSFWLSETASQIAIPKPPTKKYLDYHVVEEDNAIVISDLEVPNHNAHMLRLALLVGMNWGIKTLIWNGDIVATDQQALNDWVSRWRDAGNDTPFRADIWQTRDMIEQYGKWFTRQYATQGNHDDRVARKTKGEISLDMLLVGTGIEWSHYAYMYLKTLDRGYVKVQHPQNFSGDPVTLGQKLYNVERGPHYPREFHKCHMILGHCHRAQSGFSEDGMYEIHSTGMMRDDIRTQYKMTGSNKHKQWDGGFLAIRNGHFYNMALRNTDWRWALGDLYNESPFVTHPEELTITPYITKAG